MKKRIFSAALALVMLLGLLPAGTLTASAADNIASGTDWALDASGKLTISSDAGMQDWKDKENNNTNYFRVKNVEIQYGVTSIGKNAFNGYRNLTSITMPESLISIGESAFSYCSNLTSITIPKSVTHIGYMAFSDCDALSTVIMEGETPPQFVVREGASPDRQYVFVRSGFVKAGTKSIHVPAGKEDVYKTAWAEWADYIVDHAHSWSSDWTWNETHHWHECTAASCPVTEDSGKNGYGPHTWDSDEDTACNGCGYIRIVHRHPVCGNICGHDSAHATMSWKALDQASFTGGVDGKPRPGSGVTLESGQYKLAEGYYCLVGNVSLDKKIYINSSTVDLCLNGHTLTSEIAANSGTLNAIEVSYNATLNLCDCVGNGKITSNALYTLEIKEDTNSSANLYGGTVDSPTGICVETRGNLILDGATLTASNNYVIDAQAASAVVIKSGKVEGGGANCVQMTSQATFAMTGGTVTNTGSGNGLYISDLGGAVSGGTITSKNGAGIYLSGNSLALSGAPVITGGEADITIHADGSITVGDDLTGNYSVFRDNWQTKITEATPFAFTTASSADHSSHFTAAAKMTGIAVRNTGTGNGQQVQLYMPHNWSSGWSSNETNHWHICHNSAEQNCTITDYASCGEEGAAYGAHQWSYETNSYQHRKKCIVCSYAENSWTQHTWENDQDTTCDICGYERSVPLYGAVAVTGTPKLGEKLTASVTDAPQGVVLKYAWTITGGDGTVLSGTDAYTPTANDVGKTLTVTVTTDDPRYSGALSAVTSAVAKGDQAAPVGIFTITDAADGQSKGVIVITGDASMLEYRLKSTDGSDPAWAAATSSNELTAGTYEFRYKETATHNASPATEVQVRVLGPDAKRLTIGTITHGTVEKRRDMVNPGDPVTLAVKPADGYELTDIAAIYNDGTADKIITPTVKPDNAQQYTFTMPNADVTVTATFTAIVYTINYQWANVADGSFTVEDGTITLATPTRENYILTGWAFAENGAVIENVTAAVLAAQAAARTVKLYPIWTENETPPPEGETKGEVEVKPGTPAVSADKEVLKELAEEVQQGSDTVTVRLTVEKLDDPADKDELESVISGDKVLYLDLALLKQVNDSAPEAITNASRVLEIAVDFDFTGKKDVAVYRKHGGNDAEELAALSTRPAGSYTDGTFFASSGNGKVYIYTSKFSTYAIGYTTASQTAYTLTVNGGTGSGSYAAGTTVNISAVIPSGKRFTGWTGAAVTNSSSANTTLVMPAQNTTVTANFQNISGGGGGWSGPTAYPIEIPGTDGGKVTASPKNAASGTTVTLTLIPDEGYEAGGVTVTDRSGKQIAVTVKGDGSYTFTMPGGKVTVTGVFIKIAGGYKDCPKDSTCPIWPYTDASATAWYHDGVHYCLEHNLMVGVGAYAFAPDGTTSRAMIAVILWRLEGSPVVNYVQPFDDVAEGTWYTEAIRWAAAGGVVSGYGDGTFGPGDPVTREQLAVMLWRYAGSPAASQELNFTDTHRISGYALEAVRWAAENGILSGYSDRRADPRGLATRAQTAAMIMRFCARK